MSAMAMPMPSHEPARPASPPPPRTAAGSSADPPSRTGGGDGTGSTPEIAGLHDLMNDLLGGEAAPPLTSAGPASAAVGRTVFPVGHPEPLLAGLFWLGFVRDPAVFGRAATSLGASYAARPVVVPHAEDTRFDLLLLDPRFEGAPVARFVEPSEATRAMNLGPSLSTVARLLKRSGLDRQMDASILLTSATEMARSRRFGIAVMHEPEQLDTCAVSPALKVKDGVKTVATIGVVVPAEGGAFLGTTADHAIAAGWAGFSAADRPFRVHRRHAPSDSCALELAEDPSIGRLRRGLAGPLVTPPTPYANVFFDGAESGPTPTRTHMSWDLCLLDLQPDEMCRIYTEPDTVPGDSGAALINSADRLLGFAYRRSAYDSPVQFSSWVWAAQVCAAHDLFRPGVPAVTG